MIHCHTSKKNLSNVQRQEREWRERRAQMGSERVSHQHSLGTACAYKFGGDEKRQANLRTSRKTLFGLRSLVFNQDGRMVHLQGHLYSSVTPAQPKGLQESSRWSESAETTGKVRYYDPRPGGVPDLTIDTSRHI